MSILVLVVTIVLCLLAVLASWGRLRRGHGPRALLRGLGVVLLLAGLWLSGLAGLVGNGIRSIVDWAQRTRLDLPMEIGFGLAALGVVLVLVGALIRPRTREQRSAVRDQRRGRAVAAPNAVHPVTTGRPAARPAAPATSATDEDAEIEAILKSRGIE